MFFTVTSVSEAGVSFLQDVFAKGHHWGFRPRRPTLHGSRAGHTAGCYCFSLVARLISLRHISSAYVSWSRIVRSACLLEYYTCCSRPPVGLQYTSIRTIVIARTFNLFDIATVAVLQNQNTNPPMLRINYCWRGRPFRTSSPRSLYVITSPSTPQRRTISVFAGTLLPRLHERNVPYRKPNSSNLN